MVCYLVFKGLVSRLAGVSEREAEDILRDIEREVGHNKELIKAVVDAEGEDLKKRLRRKGRERSVAYA